MKLIQNVKSMCVCVCVCVCVSGVNGPIPNLKFKQKPEKKTTNFPRGDQAKS